MHTPSFEKELAGIEGGASAPAPSAAPASGSGSKPTSAPDSEDEGEWPEDDDLPDGDVRCCTSLAAEDFHLIRAAIMQNPFVEGADEGAGAETKSKAQEAADKKGWLKEPNRDYHYAEVRPVYVPLYVMLRLTCLSPASGSFLYPIAHIASATWWWWHERKLENISATNASRWQQAQCVCERQRYLQEDAQVRWIFWYRILIFRSPHAVSLGRPNT